MIVELNYKPGNYDDERFITAKYNLPGMRDLPPPIIVWRDGQKGKWRYFARHFLSSTYYEAQPFTVTAKMRVKK